MPKFNMPKFNIGDRVRRTYEYRGIRVYPAGFTFVVCGVELTNSGESYKYRCDAPPSYHLEESLERVVED